MEESTKWQGQLPSIEVETKLSALEAFQTSISNFITEKEAHYQTNRDKSAEIRFDVDNSNNFNIIFEFHSNLYKSFGVKNPASFEQSLAQLESDGGSSTIIRKHQQVEKNWDNFLMQLDSKAGWNTDADAATLSSDLTMIQLESFLNSDKRVSLAELILTNSTAMLTSLVTPKFTWKQLDDLDCQVIVLTFGVRKGVERWQKETGCIFPIYLDTSKTRKSYARFGMNKSLFRSRCIATVRRAMEVVERTRSTKDYDVWVQHQPCDEIDDQLQMAGDIVFASDGRLIFKHVSQHPFDRPCVETALLEIKKASNSTTIE